MKTASQPRFRFLCLEDDLHDKLLLEECLKSGGLTFEMVHTTTQREYETALREETFDLIFSDYSIPGYSGLLALAAARECQPDIPFLIVSGTIGEERAVESLKSGAADYVLKDRMDRVGPAVRKALREAVERRRRKLAEESLKESEARFRQLAENIKEVLWLMDVKTNQILYVSPAYERIWERSMQSLYRDPRSWLEAVHPGDRERVTNAFLSPEVREHRDHTYRLVGRDGSLRWIRDRVFPVKDDAGEVYRSVRIAEDVTANLALENQLRQAQKMEAIGQLAGGVAHDFNNLLCVIRGNADLVLSDENGLNAQNRECLSQIAAASERAANLTRQLLAFGRQQVMQPQPLNLNELISNLARMFARVIPENIRIEFSYCPSAPCVLADPGMLEQVLLNLVINSRDAMPSGGKLTIATGTVHLDAENARAHLEATPGDFVCLTVTDTGTGIAAEHLPHIFEPFFTTKGVHKGTGLGLATVYGIVKQHRGWIEVESKVNEGTTFRICLPAIPIPAAAEPAAEKLALRGGSETILLVEDDASVRSMTRRTLEMFGYTVIEASSAAEAIQLTSNRSSIHLLLTDVVIAGDMNGGDLARQILTRQPAVKIIFTSGYGREVSKQDTDFVRKTAAVFLQKPHSSALLISTVRRCLDSN